MARKKEPKTNEQIVMDIMTYSNYGALSQMFVIEALSKWSKRIAAAKLDELGPADGFINREAWKGVAQEISDKLDAAYGRMEVTDE